MGCGDGWARREAFAWNLSVHRARSSSRRDGPSAHSGSEQRGGSESTAECPEIYVSRSQIVAEEIHKEANDFKAYKVYQGTR